MRTRKEIESVARYAGYFSGEPLEKVSNPDRLAAALTLEVLLDIRDILNKLKQP